MSDQDPTTEPPVEAAAEADPPAPTAEEAPATTDAASEEPVPPVESVEVNAESTPDNSTVVEEAVDAALEVDAAATATAEENNAVEEAAPTSVQEEAAALPPSEETWAEDAAVPATADGGGDGFGGEEEAAEYDGTDGDNYAAAAESAGGDGGKACDGEEATAYAEAPVDAAAAVDGDEDYAAAEAPPNEEGLGETYAEEGVADASFEAGAATDEACAEGGAADASFEAPQIDTTGGDVFAPEEEYNDGEYYGEEEYYGEDDYYGDDGAYYEEGDSLDASFVVSPGGTKKKKRKKKENPLGENFEKYNWVIPDQEKAMKRGKESVWQAGENKFKETGVADFGAMSDGMELYFYTLKNFALLFLLLSLLTVPITLITSAGNNDLGGGTETRPLWANQTLGNLGVRSTKKACNSSTMTILAPIALLGRECYAYYLFPSHGNLHCS